MVEHHEMKSTNTFLRDQTDYETQDSSFNEGFKRQQSRLSSLDVSEGSDFVEGKSEVKINEYQAAWNVTNAIQVGKHLVNNCSADILSCQSSKYGL